jgi:hypothetical protein
VPGAVSNGVTRRDECGREISHIMERKLVPIEAFAAAALEPSARSDSVLRLPPAIVRFELLETLVECDGTLSWRV